ncbi:Retrovirus-related Pol polyprotein from transposon 17.6 [Vitis vinifera]|uniref:Retrovirus-related Pol polyprotein from transposon 17.6 n=1 Tax=Vitis vinifera TaxID=29760 RepID=A0A438D7W0_VITVI|nr:Retrovirus-related Pol polyprotein from transposon 17.6 [Vitis vinifera]
MEEGTHPNITTRAPRAPAAPKAVINYINGGPSDEEWDNHFPPVDPTRTLQPHRDALILSLEIGDFDVRRILVDPGSSADLVQASVVGHMGHSLTGLENPGRILSGFNGLQLHPWETLYCRSKQAQSLSTEFIPLLHLTGLTSFQLPDPSGRKLGAFTRIDKKSSGMRLTNCSKPDSSEKFLSGLVGKRSGDQIVDSTSGQGMLSFLDAFSGYHQIPMSPDDEEKTAFITPHGLYCYKVMPFGLKNAGATYQRLMTKIFKPLIGHTVEVYIDDIVVKSKTREQHVLHLQEVFHLLRKYGMKLNPSKCAFGVSAGKFLGFMVSQRGIEVSPDQVKAVMETPPPRNKKELQRLTGKLVRIRAFIARFTDELRPFFLAIRKAGAQDGRTVAKTLSKRLSIVLCNHPS